MLKVHIPPFPPDFLAEIELEQLNGIESFHLSLLTIRAIE